MTWQECKDSREAKRAALEKHGVAVPSRRAVSYLSLIHI